MYMITVPLARPEFYTVYLPYNETLGVPLQWLLKWAMF